MFTRSVTVLQVSIPGPGERGCSPKGNLGSKMVVLSCEELKKEGERDKAQHRIRESFWLEEILKVIESNHIYVALNHIPKSLIYTFF